MKGAVSRKGLGDHGSVNRENRDNAAYLKVWKGQAKLNWNRNDNANPNYGSASRRDCLPLAQKMGGL